MNLFELNKLTKEQTLVENKINNYQEKDILKRQAPDKSEIEGHIEKSQKSKKVSSAKA